MEYNHQTLFSPAAPAPSSNRFYILPEDIARATLTSAQKVIFSVLNSLCLMKKQSTGNDFINTTISSIMRHTGLSRPTITRGLKALKQRELVVVVKLRYALAIRVLPADVWSTLQTNHFDLEKNRQKLGTENAYGTPSVDNFSAGNGTAEVDELVARGKALLKENPLLIQQLLLLFYDFYHKNKRIERKNQQLAYRFVGKYGINALKIVMEKAEKTYIDSAARFLSAVFKGECLRDAEKRKLMVA